MSTSISVRGTIEVNNLAEQGVERLRWLLEAEQYDVVRVVTQHLEVSLLEARVSPGYYRTVADALACFCLKYATAGAVFDFNRGVLVLGPTEEARRKAYVDFLHRRISSSQKELSRISCLTNDWPSQSGIGISTNDPFR